MPTEPETPQEKKYGPLLGIIIIVTLLIAGGLYLANMELRNRNATEDARLESLQQQGNTDDLTSIEADLEATELDSLDSGSTELQTELNGL